MHCFEVLEIEVTVDQRKIKRAYAVLAKKYHPEDTPEEFKRIHDAYLEAMEFATRNKGKTPEQLNVVEVIAEQVTSKEPEPEPEPEPESESEPELKEEYQQIYQEWDREDNEVATKEEVWLSLKDAYVKNNNQMELTKWCEIMNRERNHEVMGKEETHDYILHNMKELANITEKQIDWAKDFLRLRHPIKIEEPPKRRPVRYIATESRKKNSSMVVAYLATIAFVYLILCVRGCVLKNSNTGNETVVPSYVSYSTDSSSFTNTEEIQVRVYLKGLDSVFADYEDPEQMLEVDGKKTKDELLAKLNEVNKREVSYEQEIEGIFNGKYHDADLISAKYKEDTYENALDEVEKLVLKMIPYLSEGKESSEEYKQLKQTYDATYEEWAEKIEIMN